MTVRFWDSSALVPLVVEEKETKTVRELVKDDPAQVVWWGTIAECVSPIRRREREGLLTTTELSQMIESLEWLSEKWTEIQPVDRVRTRAVRLLAVHPLRTADAFQLAAAITWRDDAAAGRTDFVCLDERLADAARREGFRTLPNP